MKYDKPLLAILMSLIIVLPLEIYTEIMKFLNLTTVSYLEAVSMMYIKEGSLILGILSGLGFGSWATLLIYYSAWILGTDYFPLKAMLIAMTIQSLLFITFGTLGGNQNLLQDVLGNFVHASAAAMAGLLTGYIQKKFLFDKK